MSESKERKRPNYQSIAVISESDTAAAAETTTTTPALMSVTRSAVGQFSEESLSKEEEEDKCRSADKSGGEL